MLKAGLKSIDCQFHEGKLSNSEILEQQLIENLLREDLKPLEEARGFASLMELNGWNGKQVAQALRVAESKVSRALALLRLPEDLQHRVQAGEIPARSAYELSKLNDDEKRRQLANQVATQKLTHHQAAKAVRQRKGVKKATSRMTRLTFKSENGWNIIAQQPAKSNYHELEFALVEALEEVRLRINNNVQLF
jgi:ParB family chromosome partitioning protein